MARVNTWERIERQKLRGRERRSRHNRPGERPDPSRPVGTDMLPRIKHIVVLMMENHSFDNYLGTLGRGEGFPLGDDGAPDAENSDSAGTMIRAHHATSTVQQDGVPCQSWCDSHTQWGGGKMDGFVTSTEQAAPEGDKAAAMAYWTERDLPFYHGLARTFPLADRWFSSCLGATVPNPRFMMAGTAHGLIDDLPWDILDLPPGGTIFDVLTRHDIGWFNYHNVRPTRVLLKRALGQNGLRAARGVSRVGRWFPRVTERVQGNQQFTADLYPLGGAGCGG